jgi:hypothetical protein
VSNWRCCAAFLVIHLREGQKRLLLSRLSKEERLFSTANSSNFKSLRSCYGIDFEAIQELAFIPASIAINLNAK